MMRANRPYPRRLGFESLEGKRSPAPLLPFADAAQVSNASPGGGETEHESAQGSAHGTTHLVAGHSVQKISQTIATHVPKICVRWELPAQEAAESADAYLAAHDPMD